MITIKQVEKDERLAIKTVKDFIYNHQGFVILLLMVLATAFALAYTIIMIGAALGFGMAENNMKESLLAGEVSVQDYLQFESVMDIVFVIYTSVRACVIFIFTGILMTLVYFAFKEYLKYKRDNL
jgi:hypothetical protein